MKNILFVSPDLSIGCSGVSTVVSQLADRLVEENDNYNVSLVYVGNEAAVQDSRIKVDFIRPPKFGLHWVLLPSVISKIVHLIKAYNISLVHVHGVWQMANLAGLIAARKCDVPVLLSSHGMLEQWLWKEQGFINEYKKKIYFNLVLRVIFPRKIVLHSITSLEKDNLKNYFPQKKIVTVPNAIDMVLGNKTTNDDSVDDVETTIVFLGRLHRIKGIEILLKAFCAADLTENWKMQIIGPEEDLEYCEYLKSIVRKNNMHDRISFLGPLFNEDKLQLLRRAWVLVVPSYSEVMGMVNSEAALSNTPSITTFETGLGDWEKGGGVLIHPEINQLTEALLAVAQWSIEERRVKGEQVFDFVDKNYSWTATLPRWDRLYSGMIEGKIC